MTSIELWNRYFCDCWCFDKNMMKIEQLTTSYEKQQQPTIDQLDTQ